MLFPLLLTLLIAHSTLAEDLEGKHSRQSTNNALMQYGNPAMPNPMQTINKRGDVLQLTETQTLAMQRWHETSGPKIRSLLVQLNRLEENILRASRAGESNRKLKNTFKQILKLREKIAFGKLACRANLRKQLGQEKLQQISAMYNEALAAGAKP